MSVFLRWAKRVGVGIVVLLMLGGGYIWYAIRAQDTPGPPDPALETREIEFQSDGATIAARLYRQKAEAPTAAILWMHGGAFVGGSMNMPEGDVVSRDFAHAGFLVLNTEYRKVPPVASAKTWMGSPAIRFPAPVLDCVAAWKLLLKEAAALNIPAERIFIGGASAGGSLAAMTTIWARREGLQAPRGAVLAYPVLHSSLPELAKVREVALMLVGKENEARVDEAFPGKSDLPTFPPTIIINSEVDGLRPSGEKFARELKEAGGNVELYMEPGSEHGHLNEPGLPEYGRTMSRFIDWMRKQAHE